MEHAAEEDLRCKCGQPIYETVVNEVSGNDPNLDHDYNAVSRRCRGCEALDVQERIDRKVEDPNPAAGIRYSVRKVQANGHLN